MPTGSGAKPDSGSVDEGRGAVSSVSARPMPPIVDNHTSAYDLAFERCAKGLRQK